MPTANPFVAAITLGSTSLVGNTSGLQALVNEPARRPQDEADIRALLGSAHGSLRMDLIRDYYRLVGREAELDRLLAELRPGWPPS